MDLAAAYDALPEISHAAQAIGRALLEECREPAANMAAQTIGQLAQAVAPVKKLAKLNPASIVRTEDPLRTLIRIPGYGSDEDSAAAMETIIGSARDGIKSQRLETGNEVEQFIARNYMRKLYPNQGGLTDRLYSAAAQQSKHRAYEEKFDQLFANSTDFDRVDGTTPVYRATTSINGQSYDLMTSRKPSCVFKDEYPDKSVIWSFYVGHNELKEAVKGRVNELFEEVMSTRSAPHSDSTLNQNVSRVAELEWLNANLWKYHRGSAGISQLEARTWLEAAGIDSGSYKLGIDPNLEALIHPLEDFRQDYPTYFQNPPSYFSTPSRRASFASASARTNAA